MQYRLTRYAKTIASRSVNHSIPEKCPPCLMSFRRLAPAMTGTLKKKENSVAATLPTESNIAPIIVAPERDVPGINARH